MIITNSNIEYHTKCPVYNHGGHLTHTHATSSVREGGDVVGTHLLAELLVPHADLVAAEGGQVRHRRLVHAVAVFVGLLDDALHVDVAVLAVELDLLLELGTHLGLLQLDLLLDILVGLDFKLGVDLLGDARPFLILSLIHI